MDRFPPWQSRLVACSVACSKRIVAPGGPWQYYAVQQYSVVRRVWGRGGVAIFFISDASTQPRILMDVFVWTPVRCTTTEGNVGSFEGDIQHQKCLTSCL